MWYEFKVHNKQPDRWRKVLPSRGGRYKLRYPEDFCYMPDVVRSQMALLDAAADVNGEAYIAGVGRKVKYGLGYHYKVCVP